MRRLFKFGAGLLVAVLVIFGGWEYAKHQLKPAAINSPKPVLSQKVTLPPKLEGSYLVSGDVFWGRGIDYYAQKSSLKYDWPFSRLNEFHPNNYDGWISDMECPVTDIKVPYQVQVDSLIFSCSPKYLASASKYFSAMTIANNHTSNTGAAGFADTQKYLNAAGIQAFGHYDLSEIDDLCEVVSLNVNVDSQKKKLPIVMCGYHWLSRQPTDGELDQITKYSKYFPVWVFPHGGTEYATHSNPSQQELYHKFIDMGADVVFGDHPHVVQETEAYKGKLIVYDLGNLIFDQWFNDEVTKSLIVNTRISAAIDNNLKKYLDMADNCSVFNDVCLQTAQNENLLAYKLTYTYDIIGGERSNADMNDRLTHPASAATKAWLVKRTNWAQTLSGLQVTH
ncbi:CapA family protein [Candidatus Saccharibacteria bacterium]|nr:CapA family protein [Candidatus Saccharibacteria bacterium]